MGGNVQINGLSADRMDLRKIDRDLLRSSISEILQKVNDGIWSKELFDSKKFLSGSGFYLFDDSILTDELIEYKPSFGDIDLQVDKSQKQKVQEILERNIGQGLIGYKNSVDQFISLWRLERLSINIQIDFEFVDFENELPTEWSQFAHSSSWEDIKSNVKGVFHKYLIRAFTTKTLCDIIVLTGKKQTPKSVKSTQLAFSVTRGLRKKLEAVYDNDHHRVNEGLLVYREIPTADSEYVKDLPKIFEMLFDHYPSDEDLKDFCSFVGCTRLASKYLSDSEKDLLIEGFTFTLFDQSAQMLYRDDPIKDRLEKKQALDVLLKALGKSRDTSQIEKSYYEQANEK